MMTRESFLQQEKESSMLNILLDHGSGAPESDVDPSRRLDASVVISNNTMCVVSGIEMHANPAPHWMSSECVGDHGCCANISNKFGPPNIDWLCNKPKSPEKNKGKNICMSASESVHLLFY